KPDVLGGIYRIRRKGAAKIVDPRGLKIDWRALLDNEWDKILADKRPAVRRRAIATLSAKGRASLSTCVGVLFSDSFEARRNAIWTMTQIDHADARRLVLMPLQDDEFTLRPEILHSVSLWRDNAAFLELRKTMKSPVAHIQRGAAEALGR